ncbi:hypothetical protein CA265_01185 [Sphingobacteriaceae bacterium GW460-11-11-14-LB5]|nr:hypothetical protein CA265_01185 [Sphingobacteriaceae bacterium GW460-11-11-14-LB5]
MKLYILVLLVTVTALTGCKKDKVSDNDINNQKIQGKWDLVLTRSVTFNNGKKVEDEEKIASGTTIFEFAGNTLNYIEKSSSKQRYSFTIEGDEMIMRGDRNGAVFFKFKFNSDTQLELSQRETETINNVTYEESFTYVMNKL